MDACYERLYGLTSNELRSTPFGVDPKEAHSEHIPGETFPLLKEKKIKHSRVTFVYC